MTRYKEDGVKGIFFALIFMSVFILPLGAQNYNNADFDSGFQAAIKMDRYARGEYVGTDLLVKNTADVLHKENMAILDELAKLHKEIADLKKDIKTIKGQVE